MKTLTGYKSLLPGSGLLLISLIGLHLSQSCATDALPPQNAEKKEAAIKCRVAPDDSSYIKDITEKLFPVLKSLNVM